MWFPVSSPTLTTHPSETFTSPTHALLFSSQITLIPESQTLELNVTTELILNVLSKSYCINILMDNLMLLYKS